MLHAFSISLACCILQGQISGGCVVCPAHGTAFDLATGEVKGEWCPKFPSLPLVGKMTDKKPLPTYQSRVDEAGNVEVYV
jgi:nitrite reductase/ring-hydroxylating ferredoxin subunit